MEKEDGSDSMSNQAIEKIAKVIEKNGKRKVQMTFKAMKFMGLEGHLIKMSVAGEPVKVLEKDSKGNPTKVEFELDGKPKRIKAKVEVDAMNQINEGVSSPQTVQIGRAHV